MPELFDNLTPATRAIVQALGRTVRYPPGTAVMFPGQLGDSVHFLKSGTVKIVAHGVGGKQTLLGLRGAGEILGEMSILDHQPRGSAVVAVDTVETFVVPAARFRAELERAPDLALIVMEFLVQRLRDADTKRAEYLSLDSTGRIAARIVELAERVGTGEDSVTIALPMTQAELAGWAGASVESAGRALATLRKLGWIETERRRIVVHELEALRNRATI
jgi:CRP-like cAMP-binding protein